MKKSHILLCLLIVQALLFSPASRANTFSLSTLSLFEFATSLNTQLYDGLGLAETGMDREALDYAIKGYEALVEQGLVNNSQYLTVIDFSQPIFSRRFYLIDVENRELVLNTYVMHGKNSGSVMAENFSNRVNSNQSSLGFYVTRQPYVGARGYSLRLAGLEKEFNSNAEARGVVLHGSKFINEERAMNRKVERSLGCPAIPESENREVINLLKDGSVLFIYHPSEHYITRSNILNY